MVPRARDRPVIPSEDVHRKLHPKQALSYALHLRVPPGPARSQDRARPAQM